MSLRIIPRPGERLLDALSRLTATDPHFAAVQINLNRTLDKFKVRPNERDDIAEFLLRFCALGGVELDRDDERMAALDKMRAHFESLNLRI